MTQTTPKSKGDPAPRRALRIGVLLDGRLVEERLITAGGEVLVGSDARCTLLLPPQPGVPRAVSLFTEREGRFTLVLRQGMEAQLAFTPGSQPVTLRGEAGAARQQELTEEARGRVVLGDVTLLFQVVRVAPPAARPVLPPSLHDSLIRHLDWWMVGTAAASFTAHAVLMIILRGYDPPRTPRIDDFERPAVVFTQQWQLPKPEPTPPPTSGGGGPVGPKVVKATHPVPQPRRPVSAAEIRLLVAKAIGAEDPSSNMRDLLRTGGEAKDADQVFANVGSVSTKSASLGMQERGTQRGPQVIGIPGLRGPNVGDVQTGGRTDEKTGGRIPRCPGGLCTPEPPEIPETDCQPEGLALKLRQFRGALVACYTRLVTSAPGTAGKLRLNLTIAQSGRVARAEVEPLTLDSEQLNTCLVNSARHWIFPELPCDELTLSQLLVFTPSN